MKVSIGSDNPGDSRCVGAGAKQVNCESFCGRCLKISADFRQVAEPDARPRLRVKLSRSDAVEHGVAGAEARRLEWLATLDGPTAWFLPIPFPGSRTSGGAN